MTNTVFVVIGFVSIFLQYTVTRNKKETRGTLVMGSFHSYDYCR